MMSVSKVQRSKSVVASTVYAVWGTREAMKAGESRASALSVVGPRGYHAVGMGVGGSRARSKLCATS